jgi:hypothetical protein
VDRLLGTLALPSCCVFPNEDRREMTTRCYPQFQVGNLNLSQPVVVMPWVNGQPTAAQSFCHRHPYALCETRPLKCMISTGPDDPSIW